MATKRKKPRDFTTLIGITFGVVGIALIAAFVGVKYWVTSTHVELDRQTNCPVKGPKAIHAILIDRSDPISEQQAQQIRQLIDRYIATSTAGERFDLYEADGDSTNSLRPVASVCSSGRPENASIVYQNPALIRRQFEERFVRPLRKSVDELLKRSEQPTSPILESVRAAAIASFGATDLGQVPLQLTLISDLVQHSPLNSHFRGEVNFEELASKPAWRALQANLRGAKVNVIYLLRASAKRPNGQPIQNRGHQLFWEKAFRASGAGDIVFETY